MLRSDAANIPRASAKKGRLFEQTDAGVPWEDPPADLHEALQRSYRLGMQQVWSEVLGLARLVGETKPCNVMEIGTNRGGLFYLLCYLSHPEGKKISSDIPSAATTPERSGLLRRFPGEIHELVMDSHTLEARDAAEAALAGEKLDVLFIDGDHSYAGVRQDYYLYRDLVRPGGLIGFHDIKETELNAVHGIEVSRFWNEVKDDTAIEFRAPPGETHLPEGHWDWCLERANKERLPADWAGIGFLVARDPGAADGA